MLKRRYGRTKHMSTVAVFGAVALGQLSQSKADEVVRKVLDAGVNHFDIAPTYGEAESRLGPLMPNIRDEIFLGCKTTERSKKGALKEFNRSLERLQTERFDLYQLHAVTEMSELDKCIEKGGALEGVIEMREKGLTDYIGVTGHGFHAPSVFLEALNRFNFDSVLFPINPTLFADAVYRRDALELLERCAEENVGVMIIKSVAKEPWGEREHTYHTWYMPFDEQQQIQENINFALSFEQAHICTPGDDRLLDKVFTACENFEPLDEDEQAALIENRSIFETIF
ncbi:MAG: aldo/keto reductase [Chloroflexota bacterium]|nr:aldo/keto reductase [Chloroflexota bacterium]